MKAYLPIRAYSAADASLRVVLEQGGVFPFRFGLLYWPHAVINQRTVDAAVATYEIVRVDVCDCGKPMHPLPFECVACLTYASGPL